MSDAPIGYATFPVERLADRPRLWAGDEVACPRCGDQHIVFGGLDPATGVELNVLFYRCGDHVHLAGIQGRDVTHDPANTEPR